MTTTTTLKTPAQIFAEAVAAAETAAQNAIPTPIIVGSAIGLSDKIDYTKPTYFQSEGLCGFAWVNIKPARGAFITWLKKQGIGRTDSYYGGYTLWSSDLAPSTSGSQSIERKEAAAQAFATVLRSYGIKAFAQSRLD